MDAREVLQAIESDPVLRAEARRVILTDELLALPALVQENSRQIADISRQIAAMVATADQQRAELAELKSMFARFMQGTSEVLGRIERALEGHTRILENLTIRVTRIEERLS